MAGCRKDYSLAQSPEAKDRWGLAAVCHTETLVLMLGATARPSVARDKHLHYTVQKL